MRVTVERGLTCDSGPAVVQRAPRHRLTRQGSAFALFLASAMAADLPSDEQRFMDWCARHAKQYASAVEFAERKANWFQTDA